MTKLFKKIKSLIPSGLENSTVSKEEIAEFTVLYNELEVGILKLKDSKWHFSYTSDFKNQKLITPIPDFPNLDKEYVKDELWPFFLIRIPSLKQPKVQQIISKKHIDASSQVELLKHFGKKTIANPFELKMDLVP